MTTEVNEPKIGSAIITLPKDLQRILKDEGVVPKHVAAVYLIGDGSVDATVAVYWDPDINPEDSEIPPVYNLSRVVLDNLNNLNKLAMEWEAEKASGSDTVIDPDDETEHGVAPKSRHTKH